MFTLKRTNGRTRFRDSKTKSPRKKHFVCNREIKSPRKKHFLCNREIKSPQKQEISQLGANRENFSH